MGALPLTCDLGEGLEHIDRQLMPMIDLASIACGGHAGTAASLQACVELARANDVAIGAHPSYADKPNFGRVSLSLSAEELSASLAQQLDFIQQVCLANQTSISYVKPHGALYNDMMKSAEHTYPVLLRCVAEFKRRYVLADCKLLIQAIPAPERKKFIDLAAQHGVELLFEAFADRSYLNTGFLSSRSQANALLTSAQEIAEQAKNIFCGFVMTLGGERLSVSADCLCIHGDHPLALEALNLINRLSTNAGPAKA